MRSEHLRLEIRISGLKFEIRLLNFKCSIDSSASVAILGLFGAVQLGVITLKAVVGVWMLGSVLVAGCSGGGSSSGLQDRPAFDQIAPPNPKPTDAASAPR